VSSPSTRVAIIQGKNYSAEHGCAAEAAFWATQQNRNNIKRCTVLKGENTSKKTGQMSSNFGEIIKKLIPVFGEKPARCPHKNNESCINVEQIRY
jgi:hypothetical protein